MQSATGTLLGALRTHSITKTHTHKRIHICIQFVIALKAQDKPKNSVPLVSLKTALSVSHTNRKPYVDCPRAHTVNPSSWQWQRQ